jgi:uncharacterized protein (TIGR00369 family)
MLAPTRTEGRSLQVTWQDPLDSAARGLGLSGQEYMQAIRAGEVPPPPIALVLGFEPPVTEPGRATTRLTPDERHYNPLGIVHGGIAAILLDTVTGIAGHTLLPAGTGYSTIDLKVTYVRPITKDTGPIVAEGVVLHPGRKVMSAEGRVVAERTGKLLAHGTATLLVQPLG